ncbi:translation elongation factor Ts [Candidatus Nomurabacteria bacterium]|nr:translation elongation factor Ts [Candidatus Nomurabacteria bacterium]USN94839.1 MAG: translation elongation factor Ts [Candidatus Nomurabacteria bacterium]
MSQIGAEAVKELRDKTGVSVMQCKKALEEAEGDMEKALLILQKKSSEIMAKKADRDSSDGIITIKQSGNKVAISKISCETDFVSKNEEFVKFAEEVTEKLLDSEDAAKEYAESKISELVQKIGENIQVKELESYDGETIGLYVHHDKKSGSVIILKGGTPELAKDIAMHATAMRPQYLKRDDVDSDTLEKMTELFREEIKESGKPEDIQEKMLKGKVDSYLKEITLLEQPFIKDGEKTISRLLEDNSATIDRLIYKSVS